MIPFTQNDKRTIAIVAIISGLLALACLLMGLFATRFDAEAFANPIKLLDMPSVDVNQVRWFMLLDMFGYYLLLLPVIFYTHSLLQEKTAWASFLTSLGFGYVLIGAIGAAMLAVVWPALIIDHRTASAALQEIYKADFMLTTNLVVKGVWNYLEVLLAGTWWLGVGISLIQSRGLKITTLILGASCLMDGIGELLQLPTIAEIGLNIYLVLGIVWPIWVGVAILKRKF
jgi:hypothetical protein